MRCAVVAVLLGSYLVAPVVAQTVVRIYGTVSDGTFLPVLVDSTGRLLVTISGTITPTEINLPASTCADPALSETGALTTGIAFTATPSILDCVNGTAVLTKTGTAVTSTVPYRGPVGSAAATSFNFGTAGTGLYQAIDTNGLGLASNGSTVAIAYSNLAVGFQIAQGLPISFASASDGSARAILWTNTAPTVTSAGTSPSVVANGTAAFRVNVGTGGTATTIVLAMPAATTGWNCHAENITAAAANRANQIVKQQSSTTTAVTVQNQTVSTGAALAFTASDIVSFICTAY